MSEPIFAFVVSLPAEIAYVPIARHVVETLCGLHIVAQETGPDSVTFDVREDRLTALNAMMPKVIMPINYGVSIRVRGLVVTPPPVPAPPWWSGLKLTEPKTVIYSNVDSAQVYYSTDPDNPEKGPTFDQKATLPNGQLWTLPLGRNVDVWRAPLAGSGWICVAVMVGGRALWVRGEDMRATP